MSKSKNKKWTVEQHSRQITFFTTLMVDEEEKTRAEELLSYAKVDPSTPKFKEIWGLVDKASKLPVEAMCPECHTRLRKLKLNGKDRWPLCGACNWKRKNAGKKDQRALASLAAPSAPDRAAIVDSARQTLLTAAMLGAMVKHATDVEELILEVREAEKFPELAMPMRLTRPKDWRHVNVYMADEMRHGRRPDRDDRGGSRTKRAGSLRHR